MITRLATARSFDSRIRCLTAPGSGSEHTWTVRVLQQTSLPSTATTSYAPPQIESIRCDDLEAALSANSSAATDAATDVTARNPLFRLVLRTTNSGFGIGDGVVVRVLFGSHAPIVVDTVAALGGALQLMRILHSWCGTCGDRSSASIPIRISVSPFSGGQARESNAILWNDQHPPLTSCI